MSWQILQLGDIASLSLGKMLDARKNRGTSQPYLANVNVRWGAFDLSDLREMLFEEDERERFSVRRGDIVMCEGGEPGRCAIWQSDEPIMFQKALHRIRAFDGVDARFLYYSLLDVGGQDKFSALFTGSTIKHLPKEKLRLLPVAIPAKAVQERIADCLSAYDDLFERNRRRMALLERAAREMYEEWFVRLRFPGYEHYVVGDGVPAGWTRERLSDAVAINPPTRLPKVDVHPWVEMADLSNDSMLISRIGQRAGRSGSKFRNGDVLFARITPCLENGKTAFVQSLADGAIGRGSTEFIVMRGKSVSPEFTYCLARDSRVRNHAIKSMTGASGRQRVRETCFDSLGILVPPTPIHDEFVYRVRPLFEQIGLLHQQAIKLRTARNLLLPRLMRGELLP